MIKMIAFDLDGTICDSIPLCMKALMKSLSPYVDYELTEQDIIRTFGLNEAGMIKSLVKENWQKALYDFYVFYEELHDLCAEPFPGMRKLITFLKENGIIVPLITGKGERSCKITLKKIGMEDTFDEIMYGSEIYSNKEASILFLLLKYKIEKSEFIYIADTPSDVEACNAVGVTCFSIAWDEDQFYKLTKRNPVNTYTSADELYQYFIKIFKEQADTKLCQK